MRKILLVLVSASSSYSLKDCSDVLKGRIGIIENSEDPQYWSCPSSVLGQGPGNLFFIPSTVYKMDLCYSLNDKQAMVRVHLIYLRNC